MNEQPASTGGRRFHLLEIIGEGAYGEVYLAEQDSGAGFRRKVAIKLLHASVARSKEAGRRMRDEARILGMLNHRNIVTVLDLVLLGERWAVIMEHVPGADLEQCLDALKGTEENFPPTAAIQVGAAMCAALTSAHTAVDRSGAALKVVHRDIKPSNVRLTLDGEVKVLDFGVASVQLDEREASTRGSAWLGTERYMAPERILCESDGPPGDVYATGATLFELLMGKPLGRTPVLEDRHAAFLEERLAPLAERIPGETGEAITALLLRALAAEPENRPSATVLGTELRNLGRTLEGEDLVSFCSRFVTCVPDHLNLERRAASGVLSEALSGVRSTRGPAPATESGRPEDQAAPTLLPSDTTDPEATLLPPKRGLGLVFFGITGVVALLVLGLGLAFITVYSMAPWTPETPTAAQPTEAPPPVEPTEPPAPVEPDTPEPQPEPATPEPEPAPEPDPQPTVVPAEPVQPVQPTPVPKPDPEPEPAVVDPDAPRLRGAMVVMQDGTGLHVTCGDTTASGTASARLRNFPAGDCTVRATYLGVSYSTVVPITARREVRCQVVGGDFACK